MCSIRDNEEREQNPSILTVPARLALPVPQHDSKAPQSPHLPASRAPSVQYRRERRNQTKLRPEESRTDWSCSLDALSLQRWTVRCEGAVIYSRAGQTQTAGFDVHTLNLLYATDFPRSLG